MQLSMVQGSGVFGAADFIMGNGHAIKDRRRGATMQFARSIIEMPTRYSLNMHVQLGRMMIDFATNLQRQKPARTMAKAFVCSRRSHDAHPLRPSLPFHHCRARWPHQ